MSGIRKIYRKGNVRADVVKNTQGASLVFHEKAAALGAAKIHLCIGASGNAG